MAGNAIYERKPFALPISLLYSEPVRILFCALSGSQCAAQYRILYLRNFVCWTSQGDELVSIATFTTTNSLCDESESNTRGSCTGRWESSRHCNTHTHIHIRLGFYLHSMYDALLATRCWANKMIGERNEKKTMCELRFSILFELVFVCDFRVASIRGAICSLLARLYNAIADVWYSVCTDARTARTTSKIRYINAAFCVRVVQLTVNVPSFDMMRTEAYANE